MFLVSLRHRAILLALCIRVCECELVVAAYTCCCLVHVLVVQSSLDGQEFSSFVVSQAVDLLHGAVDVEETNEGEGASSARDSQGSTDMSRYAQAHAPEEKGIASKSVISFRVCAYVFLNIHTCVCVYLENKDHSPANVGRLCCSRRVILVLWGCCCCS